MLLLIALLVCLLVALYVYSTRNFNYWKNKNVPFLPPRAFFGNTLDILTFRKSIGEACRDMYDASSGPMVGFFVFNQPCLLIRDPELIKSILIKDFHIFSNRIGVQNMKDDPIGSRILFLSKNHEWRNMRKKISPAFSTGRLKAMYALMSKVGDDLANFLKEETIKSNDIDVKDAMVRFTTDSISSVAYGITANCFKNENSEFNLVSRRILNWDYLERAISTACYFIAPGLVKLFKLRFVDKASMEFMNSTFWNTISEREKLKIQRYDLLDILIDIKKKEDVDDPYKLEGDKLVAQAVMFYMAGFETTASSVAFALYEIAVHAQVQEKIRKEIADVNAKYGSMSFEALNDLNYLEMCIKEAMRKYPVLAFLDRKTDADYTLPGTDVVVDKNVNIFVSSWGLQLDEKYYPEPHKFDPKRFSSKNIASIPPFTYLPFGEGPRNCIGARYAMIAAKIALTNVIKNFQVTLCNKTPHPMSTAPRGFLLAPKGKLFLKLVKL